MNNLTLTPNRRKLLIGGILVTLGLLLVSVVVFAEVDVKAPLAAYDDASGRWENGNTVIYLDGTTQPFSERLQFDGTAYPDACGPGTSTPWAGTLTVVHDHTDTNGAQGFQDTVNAWAIDCTSYSAGNTTQKYPDPSDMLVECVADNNDGAISGCEVITHNDIVPCTPANRCQDAIQSELQGNLDQDCDGNIDDATIADLVANDNLCFYWEAVKPPMPGPGDPVWGGNIQSRITAGGGGDKTLNSTFAGPNAIKILNFAAQETFSGTSMVSTILLIVGMLALGIGGLFLLRRSRS